jgi:hypothetical protein
MLMGDVLRSLEVEVGTGCVRLSGTCTAPHLGQHLTPDPTFVFPIRKYNLRLA